MGRGAGRRKRNRGAETADASEPTCVTVSQLDSSAVALADAEDPETTEADGVPAFATEAARSMRVSPRKVYRDIKLAETLGDGALEIFRRRGVSDADARKVGKLPDGDRQKVVALVCSGMDPRLALSTLVDPPGTDPDYIKAGKQPSPIDMHSDEEWLEDECGEVMVRLKFRTSSSGTPCCTATRPMPARGSSRRSSGR